MNAQDPSHPIVLTDFGDRIEATLSFSKEWIRGRVHPINDSLATFRSLLSLIDEDLENLKTYWAEIKPQCTDSLRTFESELSLNKEIYETISQHLARNPNSEASK